MDQETVSNLVAVTIIDLHESVEIDETDLDSHALAPGPREHALEFQIQRPAIGQTGERISQGDR